MLISLSIVSNGKRGNPEYIIKGLGKIPPRSREFPFLRSRNLRSFVHDKISNYSLKRNDHAQTHTSPYGSPHARDIRKRYELRAGTGAGFVSYGQNGL